ncbi:MAG TPA: GAF domain-containing sensor histidine kinase [Candidatus Binatia bacterium]|nr:GAF domain-containing sensor histidine kinase [Candidatus Binatia bacterium]
MTTDAGSATPGAAPGATSDAGSSPVDATRPTTEIVRSDRALYALDRATRAIAGELDIDRVLQLIVDSARDLVGAQYAALGIIGPDGFIERFITSGISEELRRRIGPLPQGHGVLGTIIRDGVTLRIPDLSKHPDSYGFPPHHPPMRSLLGVPIRITSDIVGNFYLTDKVDAPEFSAEDQELLEMFAVHAGIAMQNARLHQDVQALAVIEERLRISRDLHDGIIQSLYAVSLSLEEAFEAIDTDPEAATDRVDRAIDRLHTTISDIRTFIVGLGPETGVGLAESLQSMADELLGGTGVRLEADLAGAATVERRLSPEGAHELVQIAREALSNVGRHSGATRAELRLAAAGGEATLSVFDDGRGFDPAARLGSGHFGLANLRDRAAALGGTLRIDSQIGSGTRIIVTLPLSAPEADR